jgi:hypothetical protein
VELHTATGVRLAQAGNPLQALPWLVEALRLDAGEAAREHPHRTRIASLFAQSPTLEAMIFHERIIQHAAFSPDGRLVATASYDGTVRVTETDSGREVCPPLRHTNALLGVTYLYFVAFSPDGQRSFPPATTRPKFGIWPPVVAPCRRCGIRTRCASRSSVRMEQKF